MSRIPIFTVILVLVVSILSSCSDNGEWDVYKTSLEGFGPSQQYLVMNTEKRDSSFIAHWFIFIQANNKKGFVKITFEDHFKMENGELVLPPTVKHSEVKISPNKVQLFPLDQESEIRYNVNTEAISFYDRSYEKLTSASKKTVEKVISEYKKWDYEDVEFKEYFGD